MCCVSFILLTNTSLNPPRPSTPCTFSLTFLLTCHSEQNETQHQRSPNTVRRGLKATWPSILITKQHHENNHRSRTFCSHHDKPFESYKVSKIQDPEHDAMNQVISDELKDKHSFRWPPMTQSLEEEGWRRWRGHDFNDQANFRLVSSLFHVYCFIRYFMDLFKWEVRNILY